MNDWKTFEGHPWDALRQTILDASAPYQRLMTEFNIQQDDGGVADHVRHLLWLIPLAEALKQREQARLFYAMIHHAVIELKREPHYVSQAESLMLYAEAAERFTLKRIHFMREVGRPPTSVKLGEGSADEVADMVAALATQEK
jgi:hypothetical protein